MRERPELHLKTVWDQEGKRVIHTHVGEKLQPWYPPISHSITEQNQ